MYYDRVQLEIAYSNHCQVKVLTNSNQIVNENGLIIIYNYKAVSITVIILFLLSNIIFIISATQVFGFVIFIACNLFFAVLDLTGKPGFLLKYKIQEEKQIPVRILKPACTNCIWCCLMSCL